MLRRSVCAWNTTSITGASSRAILKELSAWLTLPREPFIYHLSAIEATREGVTCDLSEYQLNQQSEEGA